jgi:two-component system sensor histidine kinase/response regulator
MTYPFVVSPSATRPEVPPNLIRDAVFLVVDDFDSMRRVTMDHLKLMGAQRIFEADNGLSAKKVLEREPITIVLSDWNMPIMSGLELLLMVRGNQRTAHLPFIMITGEAERNRIHQAIHAGVSELLVKPYTQARLTERVERALLGRRTSSVAAPRVSVPAAPVPVPAPATMQIPSITELLLPAAPATELHEEEKVEKPVILVVDDDADNLRVVSHLFLDKYRVRIAHNGEKALAMCQGTTPPDLVLLDVMMPGIDGLEVARKLREHPASEHLPIIFVTSASDDATHVKGRELGAVDFVLKPIDPQMLRVRVLNFMHYIESHRQLQQNYDNMIEMMHLQNDVERITRHDMKGQIAGIIGLLHSMTDTKEFTSNQHSQLQLTEETALQLLNMINLSSELYKIETDSFVLDAQPVPLPQILNRLVTLASKSFAAKDLRIVLASTPDVRLEELTAKGEPMLCYSLFQNLLKNACEAAPEHSEVRVALYPGTPRKVTIDNVGAIPTGIRESFFNKNVTAGKRGGTGLGTYSARLLVQAQNGNISMETSDEHNTTRLIVELPA